MVKSELKGKGKDKKSKFPCLRTYGISFTVLFENERQGTVVHVGKLCSFDFHVGERADDWNFDSFDEFDPDLSVVLTNE